MLDLDELNDTLVISAQEKYVFKHPQPKRPKSLRIYEAHVGMSSTVCIFPLCLMQ